MKLLETLTAAFSIYFLLAITGQLFFTFNPEVHKLFILFDSLCCVVFLIDWFNRFKLAENKKRFFFNIWNFLDLLSSLPLIFFVHYIGYLRVIRLIKLFKPMRFVLSYIKYYKSTPQGDISKILKLVGILIFVMISTIGPILILQLESEVGNIKTAEDSLWWVYCTISTIGYGDRYPVTSLGRMITVIVSLGGISLFSILTGLIVNFITSMKPQK